jgi:hypothetical protein
MACGATLKRSLDFDPLHSPGQRPSPKRRRCMPMTMSPSTPPTKTHQTNPSPFGEVSPKYTSEQIAANIALEIKRMQRRRQLQFQQQQQQSASCPSPSGSSSMLPTDSGSPSSHICSPSSSFTFFNPLSPNKKDVPLFSLKQVSLVCERLLKEREDQVREEYGKVLNSKLAEQYEAFLKFNYDQIQRRLGESPASYYS